jgi:hypothetical protein
MEGALLAPGDALAADVDDGPIGKVVWRLDLKW